MPKFFYLLFFLIRILFSNHRIYGFDIQVREGGKVIERILTRYKLEFFLTIKASFPEIFDLAPGYSFSLYTMFNNLLIVLILGGSGSVLSSS